MSIIISTVFHAEFNGLSSPGAVSVPGLKVGDWVVMTAPAGNIPQFGGLDFENVVSVDDQLQQTSPADLSPYTFKSVFFRGS